MHGNEVSRMTQQESRMQHLRPDATKFFLSQEDEDCKGAASSP